MCCYLREDYNSEVTTSPLAHVHANIPQANTAQQCGIRRKPDSESALQSDEAVFGEFPWHTLIYSKEKKCAGAIVAPHYVVTLAECVIGLEKFISYVGYFH